MTRTAAVHPYQLDATSAPDHRGDYPCTCTLPATNRVHAVPTTDPDQTALDARRLGERPEGDR